MTDTFTTLNPGTGGDTLDEQQIVYQDAPTIRKRQRVVITGTTQTAIADVISNQPNGTEPGLSVRIVEAPAASIINTYGLTTLVVANIETTVSTYTVPVSSFFRCAGFNASGNIHARYVLYIDNVPQIAGRSSVAIPSISCGFLSAEPVLVAGQTVSVKVTHYSTGLQGDFEGTILGRLT